MDTSEATDYTAVYIVVPLVIIVIIVTTAAVYFYLKRKKGQPEGKLSTSFSRERAAGSPQILV